jgi:hypothetical protein
MIAHNLIIKYVRRTVKEYVDAATALAEKKGLGAKGTCATPHAKASQAKLNAARVSINDVTKTSFDSLGTWSDDAGIDLEEDVAEVDVSEEKVKELLNQEFLGKL